ncbi:MAG: hypothetical protein ACJAZ1_001467 [Yoonia sp.]|jgi:hypothetical protein
MQNYIHVSVLRVLGVMIETFALGEMWEMLQFHPRHCVDTDLAHL